MSRMVTCRVSDKEYDWWVERAQQHGFSLSEWMRFMCNAKSPRSEPQKFDVTPLGDLATFRPDPKPTKR